jgi:hypothetical protein
MLADVGEQRSPARLLPAAASRGAFSSCRATSGSNSGTPENKSPSVQGRQKPAHLQALTDGTGTAGARRPEFLPGFRAQMGPPVPEPAFVGSKKDADLQGL